MRGLTGRGNGYDRSYGNTALYVRLFRRAMSTSRGSAAGRRGHRATEKGTAAGHREAYAKRAAVVALLEEHQK